MMQRETSTKQGMIPYWVKIVILFFLGWLLIYAARYILSPVLGGIQQEFSLSKSQIGLIASYNFIAYTILQIPAGILGDKIGKKKILVPGFLLFGIFTVVTGLMPTYAFFITAWFMVGAAQGTFYGPQYALSSEAIPEHRITIGSAIINSGMAFGTSIGYFISTYVYLEYGMSWRIPFFIVAALIIIVGLFMWKVIKEKPAAATNAEAAATAEPAVKFKMSSLFKNRNLLMAYITIFCSIYGFFMILTWLPYYLEHERGLEGGSIAYVASLLPWAAIPGSLIFSYISDRMGRRRPVLLVMLPVAFLATASIVYFDSMPILYTALIVYGVFGKISTNPVLVALVAKTAPKEAYSTAFSVYNFIGMTSSIISPYAAGYISDKTGSLTLAFYLAAALLLVGFVAMLFVKEEKPERTATA